MVIDKIRDDTGAAVAAGSASLRLDWCPDVVQVLKNDPLRPLEMPPSQRSVLITVASAEPRTKGDVTTLADQGPCESSSFV